MSRRLGAMLVKMRVIRPEDLRRIGSGESLVDRVAALGFATDDQIARSLAAELRLPHEELTEPAIGTEALSRVPRELAERHAVFPLALRGGWLHLAMADPLDLDAIRDVEFRSGLRVRPAVATPVRVRAAIARGYAFEESVRPRIGATSRVELNDPFAGEPTLDLDAPADATPAVRMVNLLLGEGLRAGASDIHIEPGVEEIAIRNRVDGVLRNALVLPRGSLAGLVSRLKILAHLDIAERRRPQDGRLRVRHRGRMVDVRLSTLPTHRGEKIVLRLLDPERAVLALPSLGLDPDRQALLEEVLRRPQGTVLVTGPTGSGKTSTLYAALGLLRSPGINVVTLENPVEFQIPGVTQVHMNERTGLTFAASLRSIVRQDPDVIMIGEIRDVETAEIAFQAALTGHLVLSTLHTNSAAAAVTRLLDLGVEPFLIASSVSLIVAQRLVRRLCAHCREPVVPSADERDRLGLGEAPIFRPRGCDRCGGTGFAGRLGVFELLPFDARLRELVGQRAPEAALRREAGARGFPSLLEAAVAKVASGLTGSRELLRVVLHEESERDRCPACGGAVAPAFAVCPACATLLRSRCAACREALQPEWRVCPFCGVRAPLESRQGAGYSRREADDGAG